MRAWRIAKMKYALDRSGTGGTWEGGRWHERGRPVIYAGLSAEIAALEKLVHTGKFLPRDLVLVEITLPDGPALYEQRDPASLPAGWDSIPAGDSSARIGAEFLRSALALGLIVPSAIVREAGIIVINPLHPRFPEVTMKISRPFAFDQRLGN
ncbi:MAG: RES family NAD+ phosphorylase [Pseudomonadota bacterium]|nr:RES family NAD+ phosphorylase [Pseudomonadota bacterium]